MTFAAPINAMGESFLLYALTGGTQGLPNNPRRSRPGKALGPAFCPGVAEPITLLPVFKISETMEKLLLSLSAVIVLGVAAQWVGWRFRLPSILILLVSGILAGPVTGFIDPHVLLGDLLYPVVSLAVAVVLFEGGLSLTLKEFRAVGGVALRLVTVGVAASWFLVALAGHWVLGLDWSLSILLGAVLVVTGPTVIIPMLQQIRPAGAVGPILKWEGIVIDPIGAMLAVLVLQVITLGDVPFDLLAWVVAKTLLVGILLGAIGAVSLVVLLRKHWVPDFLQNSVTLMLVVVVFVLANNLQHESGLLAVTAMGFALANQKYVSVHHIIEFKENLRVMLIASIFILLAASLRPSDLAGLGWRDLVFLVLLVAVVRPASVYLATLGTRLAPAEKMFLSALAPRGIVAAAVSSIFALRLTESGYPGGETLVAVTFLVIIGTVAIYGLSAAPLAKRLKLAKAEPDGVLVLGGSSWARQIALALRKEEFPVMLVDNNRGNILAARMEGVPAFYASVFAEPILDEVELSGIGKLLALTSNDDTNSLAVLHFERVFGREQIYQLPPQATRGPSEGSRHLRGRTLFGDGANHAFLTQSFLAGWSIKRTRLSEEFKFEAFKAKNKDAVIPLFLITEDHRLLVFTAESKLSPQPGQVVISLARTAKESPREAD